MSHTSPFAINLSENPNPTPENVPTPSTPSPIPLYDPRPVVATVILESNRLCNLVSTSHKPLPIPEPSLLREIFHTPEEYSTPASPKLTWTNPGPPIDLLVSASLDLSIQDTQPATPWTPERPAHLPPRTQLTDQPCIRWDGQILLVVDVHPLVFSVDPDSNNLTCHYRHRFEDDSVFRYTTKVTTADTKLITYLHRLNPTYPIYYFFEGDHVKPRTQIKTFIDIYLRAKGSYKGIPSTPNDFSAHGYYEIDSDILRLPSSDQYLGHAKDSARYKVPWVEYLACLPAQPDTLAFWCQLIFYPQNPVLRFHRLSGYDKHNQWGAPKTPGNYFRDLKAEFTTDEVRNTKEFEECRNDERLALVLFVFHPTSYARYQDTGRLNVFGTHVPTFKRRDNLDLYRPLPHTLLTLPPTHAAVQPPLRD